MIWESNQDGRPLSALSAVPQWDERLVKIRWHKSWFDGPMDGSIEYQSGRYWFEFWCDTEAPGNAWYYFVYPMSSEESDAADAWHEIDEKFARKWRPLGNDPLAKDTEPVKQLIEDWKRHDDSFPAPRRQPPIAWFCSGQNASFYGVQVSPD